MLAMRSNERAAAAAGVNVSSTKLLAFGDLGVHRRHRRRGDRLPLGQRDAPTSFDYSQSLMFFAFAYLGGIASVSGAVAGGFLVAGGLVFTFLRDDARRPDRVHAHARRARR